MKKNLWIQLFILSAITFTTNSCNNYYKAIVSPAKGNEEKYRIIDSLNNTKRYLVLRNGQDAYHLTSPQISNDKQMISFMLDTLSLQNKLHMANGRGGKMRYERKNPEDKGVVNQAHLYINPDSSVTLNTRNLKLNAINSIEILKHDSRRSTNSKLLGIGITLGVLIIVGIILASTVSFDLNLGGH